MNRPRDEFERELYGDESFSPWQIEPVWQFLALAVVAYLIAGSLAFYSQNVELAAAEFESVVLVGGLLVTVGSGILAGGILLLAAGLLSRARRACQCG